ncbi:hypothetical protein IAD21_05512 [Abditibacteriota bacterium]|nr:hypothetical protein IAD21_05512 [Abditibacteriota bacterium]
MKLFRLWILIASMGALTGATAYAASTAVVAPETTPVMTDILANLKPSHPRLLASTTSWDAIQARRHTDADLDAFLKRSEVEARAILAAPPIPYKKDGKRLLHVSRVVLRRVLLLSLQSHLTGDPAFAERAKAEMLNVAAFNDWNPSHFLDTAEMTAAVAIGYDWFYDSLDATTRQTLKTAIAEKGLKAGLADKGFANAQNNWNSVCLCGMSLGALAIAEDEPELARQTLQKTRDFNINGLKVYAPEGVYPEGAMYWGYGTTFQVILLDALQTSLGTDWGLGKSPGFLQTADSIFQMQGPTGAFFNFSDGVERPGLEGATFWFAHQLNRPELTQFERGQLQKYAASTRPADPGTEGNRTLPLAALWWPDTLTQKKTALPLNWYGHGPNPIAIFRSAWNDPNACFLALKGGKASNSHGHMDAGSFVFESDGVRWARDLGMQDYLSLESRGVDLWNSKQDGGRWNVFRLGPFSHNTLTINGQLHQTNGNAKITNFSSGDLPNKATTTGAIVDLTPVFAGQASRVTRGFSFDAGKRLLIKDELEGLKEGDKVRWAMVTNAQIAISPEGNQATLTQDGKTLGVHLNGDTRFEIVPAQGTHDYDQTNPNAQILIFTATAPASGNLNWSVSLSPQSTTATGVGANPLAQTSLANWPIPAAQ